MAQLAAWVTAPHVKHPVPASRLMGESHDDLNGGGGLLERIAEPENG
jgi:hypothetical protein